ncbi:MAG: bifunctional folylpolyglutamate synthase/dihydrofolate synthase [Proteobacteria bacterium]|nr:bifunctional folylpolyglutamate synthase/dihydrofolate synthase [Pseudomonadota bacterium]
MVAHDLPLQRFSELFGPEFGHGKPFALAPLRAALNALGNPQGRLPPVIHVAGTNGKGSTIAFMRAIAEAAGLRVHAFTKPHLLRLNERFVVDGEIIGDEPLIAAVERVWSAGDPTTNPLTQFDAHVAAAFLLFSETPADITLIETGMGGRDDSTNVIAKPAATIISPIALDHQDVLGPTLADIAIHKAGILKPGVSAIVARQRDEAREVIETAAEKAGAPLHVQGVHWDAYAAHGRLAVQTEDETLDLPLPALAGAHQIDNAGLAAAALLYADAPIPNDAFAAGIANARWPARLQALTRGPFSAPIRAGGGEVWIDVGHNAHAAAALAQALRAMRDKREAQTIAVVGVRARKDAGAFIAALAAAVDRIIAVPLNEAHIAPAMLVETADVMGVEASAAPSLAAAMQNAAQSAAPRVLICGSSLLAAEALAAESV